MPHNAFMPQGSMFIGNAGYYIAKCVKISHVLEISTQVAENIYAGSDCDCTPASEV